jgi:hypothetical protein
LLYLRREKKTSITTHGTSKIKCYCAIVIPGFEKKVRTGRRKRAGR